LLLDAHFTPLIQGRLPWVTSTRDMQAKERNVRAQTDKANAEICVRSRRAGVLGEDRFDRVYRLVERHLRRNAKSQAVGAQNRAVTAKKRARSTRRAHTYVDSKSIFVRSAPGKRCYTASISMPTTRPLSSRSRLRPGIASSVVSTSASASRM